MTETLFLVLGKGQQELDPNLRNYRTATYHLENSDQGYHTPFVGSAIIAMHPGRYESIHIFGTRRSMWEAMLLEELVAVGDENALDRALSLQANVGTISEHHSELLALRDLLETRWGAKVSFHIIPEGRTPEELWEVMHTLTSINLKDTKLSIDITHGLRYQPFFLYIAAQFYMKATQRNVVPGATWYGGLELGEKDERGIQHAPLLDLSIFADIIRWTDAAYAMNTYGDSLPLAERFRDLNQPELASMLSEFTIMLNMNLVHAFVSRKSSLESAFREAEQAADTNAGNGMWDPFRLMKDQIISLPRKMYSESKLWKTYLLVTEFHYASANIGLAVQSLWAALLARVADGFGHDRAQQRQQYYSHYSNFVRRCDRILPESAEVETFIQHTKELHYLRDRVAHLGTHEQEISGITSRLESLITYFTTILTSNFVDNAIRDTNQDIQYWQ